MTRHRGTRVAGGARAGHARTPELRDYPDDARIWIFGVERELNPAERGMALARVDGFLAGWAAHGVPLRAARSWVYDRFLIVCADIRATHPSGCSIDALVRVLGGLEADLGARFLGNEAVWYREAGGGVARCTRAGFRALALAGGAGLETVVFDNSITALGELRSGRWEGPAGERWHRALLRRGGAGG